MSVQRPPASGALDPHGLTIKHGQTFTTPTAVSVPR